MNTLEATNVSVNKNFYYLAVLLNVSNCFLNPVVYTLRISEFRKALSFLWCERKSEIRSMNANGERNNRASVLTRNRSIIDNNSDCNNARNKNDPYQKAGKII